MPNNKIVRNNVLIIIFALAASALVLGTFGCGRGPAGRDGTNGAQGPQGDKGDQGIQGVQGLPGQDANPYTVVQLCPGVPSYPSTFIEVAFCLNGNLYGTYSTNGGFSTLLTPGTYNSNGIGSSCTFTVGPNCGVTN